MNETLPLHSIIVLLATAVVVVALFRKFKASAVAGYLAAGALVGPGGFQVLSHTPTTKAIAEFGVMFLLFVIGLELSWERLRNMRARIWFIALLQVLITACVFATGLRVAGAAMNVSIAMGGALALSSTAFVVQLLKDQGQTNSPLGRLGLAILLVQDLAAVPLLAIIPTFANPNISLQHELLSLAGKAALATGLILLFGRLLLGRVYGIVASLHTPEIMTALTLLVVMGTGMATHYAGLSLPLGAFLAGLLMAETEYRHQVEADVLPYKGLFLGLFFMATGMSIDIGTLWQNGIVIASLTLGSMAVKALVLFVICQIWSLPIGLSISAGLTLSQGGEFAFILFQMMTETKLLSSEWSQILTMVVTFTMVLTPTAVSLGQYAARRAEPKRRRNAEELQSEMTDITNHVIILGFGRVGQTTAKLLSAESIPYIAVDAQVSTVLRARKIGLPVYFGDGSRQEVLRAIGADRARAAIITLNNADAAEFAVRSIRAGNAQLPIIARAKDLKDVLSLEAAGADIAVSEMFESSLQLGGALLKSIGVAELEITRILDLFRSGDYALARGTLEVKRGDIAPPKDASAT